MTCQKLYRRKHKTKVLIVPFLAAKHLYNNVVPSLYTSVRPFKITMALRRKTQPWPRNKDDPHIPRRSFLCTAALNMLLFLREWSACVGCVIAAWLRCHTFIARGHKYLAIHLLIYIYLSTHLQSIFKYIDTCHCQYICFLNMYLCTIYAFFYI